MRLKKNHLCVLLAGEVEVPLPLARLSELPKYLLPPVVSHGKLAFTAAPPASQPEPPSVTSFACAGAIFRRRKLLGHVIRYGHLLLLLLWLLFGGGVGGFNGTGLVDIRTPVRPRKTEYVRVCQLPAYIELTHLATLTISLSNSKCFVPMPVLRC